jgi:hypothetical protein
VTKLIEEKWFTEEWATNVRDAVRALARSYAEAYAAVDRLPKLIQRVRYGGFKRKSVWVVKSLLREAVANHVQGVLAATAAIRLRAFKSARPTADEVRLPVKRTAPEQVLQRALAGQGQFVARQQAVSKALEEAAGDIKALLEAIGSEIRSGEKAFKTIIKAVRRLLPLAWTGVVFTQLNSLSSMPQWQLVSFAVFVTAIYHGLAWLTLPFHDAADRQYVLFEGDIGTASDGLAPMFPPVSRREKALFDLLGSKAPIVVSWEILVPLFHYAVVSILLVLMVVKLPFTPWVRLTAGGCGLALVGFYIYQITCLWRLIRQRYREYSFWDIVLAVVLGTQAFVGQEEESSGESDAAKESRGE